MHAKSGPCLDDNFVKCSLNTSNDIVDNEFAETSSIMTTQVGAADYSKEFEDVLELMARLAISIKSLVDPQLRKEVEETVQHSNEITMHDCAAALQLTSKIEFDDQFLAHTSDRMMLLHQRIIEGPLTENHFLVLKLLCESEVHDTSVAVNEDKAPFNREVASQLASQRTLHVDSEISTFYVDSVITEDKISCDKPLLDVLMLLKSCDLEPSYLMQKESRNLIENKLSNQQGLLPAEHLAVMQLISQAEIESDLSIDSMRKCLLEKRIKDGPLNADHLNAALSLHMVEGENLPQTVPIVPSETGEMGTCQLKAAGLDHQVQQQESFENPNTVDDVEAGHGALAQEIKTDLFKDTVFGLKVKTSLLSREEKSALQLIELKAKTASIQQSLPEWVKNGLVPPKLNCKPSPPTAVLAESLANFTDQNAGKNTEQISCGVQADFGFLSDFMPSTAQAKLQHDALSESLFLNVDQNVDFSNDEPQPVPGWQPRQLEGQVLGPGLSPTSPSMIRSSLSWLTSSLAQCVSSCLQAVLGACSSGLGCLVGLVKRPG
jgi:hypothetical protein